MHFAYLGVFRRIDRTDNGYRAPPIVLELDVVPMVKPVKNQGLTSYLQVLREVAGLPEEWQTVWASEAPPILHHENLSTKIADRTGISHSGGADEIWSGNCRLQSEVSIRWRSPWHSRAPFRALHAREWRWIPTQAWPQFPLRRVCSV